MGRQLEHFNPLLIIPILVLVGFSLSLLYSISPGFFWQQGVYLVVGILFFFAFALFDYQIFRPFWPYLYVFGIVFLLVSFLGPNVRGSTRWLEFGAFRLQPSELAKPIFLLVQAGFLSSRTKYKFHHVIIFLILFAIPAVIVFKQPDLGNAIIYMGTTIGLLFLSPVHITYILGMGVVSGALLPFGWHLLHEYQKHRILSFLNPQLDSAGTGYNAIQAMIAIGSGGLLGKGLGQGTQSHLRFLPENHTDFIFASLSEELGFVGASLLIATYFFLFLQLILIYRRSSDSFGQYFVLGVFIQLFLQVVVNIGMNIGILPITGITLPLVSYGGSSIISTCVALGIVQRIWLADTEKQSAIAIS